VAGRTAKHHAHLMLASTPQVGLTHRFKEQLVHRRRSVDHTNGIAPGPLYLLKRNIGTGDVVIDGFLIERIAELDDDIVHSAGEFGGADKLGQTFIILFTARSLTAE